jgi:hypothetical protein
LGLRRFSSQTIFLLLPLTGLLILGGTHRAVAEPGSTGGTIRDDKTARPNTSSEGPHKSAPQPRGDSNFDGTWIVHSVGNSCGTGSGPFVVIGNKIVGHGLSGSISPSGAAEMIGLNGSVSVSYSGNRFSGRSASGNFKRAGGCVGTWGATKQ